MSLRTVGGGPHIILSLLYIATGANTALLASAYSDRQCPLSEDVTSLLQKASQLSQRASKMGEAPSETPKAWTDAQLPVHDASSDQIIQKAWTDAQLPDHQNTPLLQNTALLSRHVSITQPMSKLSPNPFHRTKTVQKPKGSAKLGFDVQLKALPRITAVYPGSWAASSEVRLEPGYVLEKIAGNKVSNANWLDTWKAAPAGADLTFGTHVPLHEDEVPQMWRCPGGMEMATTAVYQAWFGLGASRGHTVAHSQDDSQFCADYAQGKLGQGATGEVTVGTAHLKDGDVECAIKRGINAEVSDSSSKEEFKNEVDILVHMLKAPAHIVRIYGFNEDYEGIAMEKLSGGDLAARRNEFRDSPIGESRAASLMKQVLEAINDCHQHHVAHRDVKPEQFVFTDGEGKSIRELVESSTVLKLIDFGESVRLEGASFLTRESAKKKWDPSTVIGTAHYIAPEMWRNDDARVAIERGRDHVGREAYEIYKLDVWSAGVMAFEMTTGRLVQNELKRISTEAFPKLKDFQARKFKSQYDMGKIDDTDIDQVLERVAIFAELHAFLKKALKVMPAERSSAAELLDDPWIATAR